MTILGAHSNCVLVNGSVRNASTYLRSPHWIPSLVKPFSSVAAAQHVRMEPYIIGMKPSRLYVKAHQQMEVIDSIRIVESHTG